MSENEQNPHPRRCPVCHGELAPLDTICAGCRAELEQTVMSVRAEDYPPPARVVHAEPDGGQVASVGAPLEAQLGAAVDDDLDLVPLAPLEDIRRSPVMAHAAAGPARSAAAISAPPQPAPVSSPVEMDVPAKALRPQHRWKLIVAVIVATLVAIVLAGVLWSHVVPTQPTLETPQSAQP